MTAYSEIVDLTKYNALMAKSMMDKLFFVDKIEPDVIVDFGCANGVLLKHIASWMPDSKFVGYDNNPKVIKEAQELTPNWDREVKENYMPLFREDLLSMIPPKYRVIYHEHYVLPYLRRTVRNDFGIELKDPTHLKIILEYK